jgi:hypothetical protein
LLRPGDAPFSTPDELVPNFGEEDF